MPVRFHGVYHHSKISLYLRHLLLPFCPLELFASDFSMAVGFLSAQGVFPMSGDVKHLLWLYVLLKICISQFR